MSEISTILPAGVTGLPTRLVGEVRLLLRRLARDSAGVTALEYALIAAVVVLVVSTMMPGIQTSLHNVWTDIRNAL